MSQAQTPANPSPKPKPNQHPTPSSNPNPPPASMAPPDRDSAAPWDKVANAADYLGPSDTAVATLKRQREEDATGGEEAGASVPPAKRRLKATHDLIYRIVVPARQIGKVIGRSGQRIQKIREDTKASIKIADAISGGWGGRHEERVIIISSKDSDNNYCDAENALHQIVSLILQDDGGDVEALKVDAGYVAANTVRLLIAGSQAGGLIGVSGQNIVDLRNTSGASIIVLSPNQVPPCASAHETDRIVQISGEIPAVLRAVVEVGCQLRDNPPKQVISFSPANNIGFRRQPQQYVDPNPANNVTLDLMVPENLVGGLIGRFGANISRIRNESGANIKVHGGRGEQTQRQIHLSGSPQQIALAKQRVDEYVYAELMRQAGGQLPQFTGQVQQFPSQQPVPEVSNTLYQGYGHPHGLYTPSNQEAGILTALPQMYAPNAMNQAPQYYGHPSYPAPQL
ncbi:hypothetical protein OROGR_032031 [Orobanche gracilis]